MSQDAPHSAKSAHRAPRTIRRVLDANTHTLSWNQLDPAVQTALSNTELRALFNRLAVDMVAFHKNVQQRAENAYTIFSRLEGGRHYWLSKIVC